VKSFKEFRKSMGFPITEYKDLEELKQKYEKPLKEDVIDQLRSIVK
jgi:hypothetical protein